MAWNYKWCSAALLALTGCPDDTTMASGGGGGTTSAETDAATETDGLDGTTVDPDGTDSSGEDTTATDESTGEPPPPDIDPEPDPPGLASAWWTTCHVQEDGTMTCWGDGSCGISGNGGTYAIAPTPTATDNTWASMDGGVEHACAIAQDRSLWCWGNGHDGKVGDGVLDDGLPFEACRLELMEVAAGTEWARLSLGWDHTCGVQTDGTLWCWGNNEVGQIGDGAVGSSFNRIVPTQIGSDDWLDVYAGQEHSCGLHSSGAVWCWGWGFDGELGMENVDFSSTPVEVPGLPPMVSLATGGTSTSTCALTEDGTPWCWGENASGVTGLGTEERVFMAAPVELPEPVIEIHVSQNTACALSEGGGLWCWGTGSQGQLLDGVVEPGHMSTTPVAIPGDDWIDVAAGVQHICGRNGAGETLCWGNNDTGQVGDGTSGPDNHRIDPVPVGPWGGGTVADDWVAGSSGQAHSCGLREDGSMWCWGSRASGRLGNDDANDDCSPANPGDCIVTTPVAVTPMGGAAWEAPRVGQGHTCARQTDGSLWCWGANGSGQLGFAGDDALVPTQVGAAIDWTMVEIGAGSTCGLRAPGTLWCWGSNSFGALGNGTEGGNDPNPTQVGAATNWDSVSMSGGSHACGLRGDQLWCWGRNNFGQLGLGFDGDPVTAPTPVTGTWSAVSAGGFETCAIATNGSLWCWGVDDPIVDTPTQLGTDTDWVQVATGGSTSCGRRADGSLWCWGDNRFGQLGQGTVDDPPDSATPLQVGTDTDWLDISVYDGTACGRRGSTLWCWGNSLSGQQGNDTVFVSGTPREVRNDD